MRGQVQTMSRTGCLVSDGFIPSLSICLHYYPTWFRAHFQGPGPGQLHLPWSLSSHPCLPACPPSSSHQRVPVSTFLRSSGSSALTPISIPSAPSSGQTLIPHFGLHCVARPAPVPPPALTFSLSSWLCFQHTGKALLPGLCVDCSLSWDHSQPRHRDG